MHAYGKTNKTGQVKVCVRECLIDKDMEVKVLLYVLYIKTHIQNESSSSN